MAIVPSRRRFLQSAAAVALGFKGLRTLLAGPIPSTPNNDGWTAAGFGPLRSDPEKLLDLPDGFSYRVISRVGEMMSDGFYVPGQPDGMCAFSGNAGQVILIRNHENKPEAGFRGPFGENNELVGKLPPGIAYDLGKGRRPCIGGTTTLVYDPAEQRVIRQFLSLAGTEYNCAGGPTPWNTWVSCEETVARAGDDYEQDHGYPFEVPASDQIKLAQAVPIKPMGRFRREAVAVEPRSGIVYQTEDREDGLFYRYLPNRYGELLLGGRLQMLSVRDQKSLDTRNWLEDDGRRVGPEVAIGARMAVRWMDIESVPGLRREAPQDELRFVGFGAGAARFARAEGIWYGRDAVYFACTDGGRIRAGQIWRYVPSPFEGTPREEEQPGMLELFLEPNDRTLLENADNLTLAPWGDVIACEDGAGDQYLVGITPEGRIYKLARNAADEAEFAGVTFAPDGKTLFVNLQSLGLTLAITGSTWG